MWNVSHRDSSITQQDLADQSIRLKEEQLRREEQKFREIEVRVQKEIQEKRQELLAREAQLRDIEARIQRESIVAAAQQGASTNSSD
jgi:cell division control protein 11